LQPEIQRIVNRRRQKEDEFMTKGSKTKGEYKVRLGGPDEKVEFELGDSFFTTREFGDWEGGKIQVAIDVIKTTGVITLEFHLKGILNIVCDRCLEHYPEEIDTRQTLFVKFGEESYEVDENVVFISRDENQIDTSQFLNEFLILALPLKKVHTDKEDGSSGCNEKMIEKLEEHLIQEVEESSDPRWNELKKLKDKN
jgi:uncharacterized protein